LAMRGREPCRWFWVFGLNTLLANPYGCCTMSGISRCMRVCVCVCVSCCSVWFAFTQECIWRGQRGSELARGHWRVFIRNVGAATSQRLQHHVSMLPDCDRAAVLHSFTSMKTMWTEEMTAKFAYWDELPHLALGMWPLDNMSQSIAKKVVERWEAVRGTPMEKSCHRVTYRLLHPDAGNLFRQFITHLATSGECHADLEAELLEMNMVATCELRIEEVHARIKHLNTSTGRHLDPAALCSRLRFSESLASLSDWQCRTFVLLNWRRRALDRLVLQFAMQPGFCKHARYEDCVRAVYHSLPRQHFAQFEVDSALHKSMQNARAIQPEKVHEQVKLVVSFLKERLSPGTLFSLPFNLCHDILPRPIVEPDSSAHGSAIVPVLPEFDPGKVVDEACEFVVVARSQGKSCKKMVCSFRSGGIPTRSNTRGSCGECLKMLCRTRCFVYDRT
jgi:hypothetical protein